MFTPFSCWTVPGIKTGQKHGHSDHRTVASLCGIIGRVRDCNVVVPCHSKIQAAGSRLEDEFIYYGIQKFLSS
jgi:hypothetical protein